MKLNPVDVVDSISPEAFQSNYYIPAKPVIIKDLAKAWPAYTKWNWAYFNQLVGHKKVGIYNNIKSDSYTPVNTADAYKTFGEYIQMISQGPAAWRIFLFNIFDHAPQLVQDFTWPEHLFTGFVKKYPMLFVGGATSITHLHFDIDMSHILHTQFAGRKRVLLFPNQEQYKLYRKPFEVLSLADFSHYYDAEKSKVDLNQFPTVALAEGYDITMEPGDTLFMPAGFWHHMEYLDSGFAMSLRAVQPTIMGKLHGAWNLFGMRTIDTVLKKTLPKPWYRYKTNSIARTAEKVLHTNGHQG